MEQYFVHDCLINLIDNIVGIKINMIGDLQNLHLLPEETSN